MPRWDATVGAVTGEHGVLLIDSGATLGEGARLRRQAQELFGLPPRWLVLTHPHFDHVLGAAAFAGTEVYAAVGTDEVFARGADRLHADAVRHGVDRSAAAEAADVLVRPHHLVSGEYTLWLGGTRRVLLANVGPGHTGHDLVVLVPDGTDGPQIVFCGDLVEESGAPQAGSDAAPRHWPDALDRLLALGGDQARYVPGHGAVVDAAFVRAQRDELARRFGVTR